MNFIVFLLLVIPVLLSGSAVLLIKTNARFLKLITAFSGAYLLSISFLEIIPEIYSGDNAHIIGIFILLGFFIQLLLDFISKGVEHGHDHSLHSHHSIQIFPLLAGVCLHSYLEGMPLAESFSGYGLQNTLLTGIIIHNIPISIILMSLLLAQNNKKTLRSFLMLLIFALAAPAGTLTSYLIGLEMSQTGSFYFDIILAMVVGIFLHISTTILFETDENHRFNLFKFLSIALGAAAAAVMM